MAKGKLTPKQAKFCKEYLVDLNATQAAIRAGYSQKTAYSHGQRLLKNVEIQNEIQRQREGASERTEVTIDRCLKEYACLAFLDTLDVFNEDGTLKNIQDMPESARRAIAGIEVTDLTEMGTKYGTLSKVKLSNKKDALDSLMRHLGGFNDKVQIELAEGLKLLLSMLPMDWQDKIKQKLVSRYKK